MTHPLLTGIVVGWVSLMVIQLVALWLFERHIDKDKP